jgi:hypothetical protein
VARLTARPAAGLARIAGGIPGGGAGRGRARVSVWRVLGWLSLGWLGGCAADAPDADLQDYRQRVARVLAADIVPVPEPAGPAYPLRRALRVEIPRSEIDLGEFFDLHGCDMGALVGFRNSPLGRTQGASQRLGYEAAWLAAARRCAAAPTWVEARSAAKQAQLPALFWNALFAGDEMRIAAGASQPIPAGDFAWLLREFADQFDALERGTFQLDTFERALAELRTGSRIGPARQAWARWRAELTAVARVLDTEADRVCRNGRPTPRARNLSNVFARFYIEGLQPRLAAEMRGQEAWIRELAALLARLEPVAGAAFADWYGAALAPQSARSEWSRTQAAVLVHARAWQRLFSTCGLDPAAAVRQD